MRYRVQLKSSDENGTALFEFALAVPVFLLLFAGGFYCANFAFNWVGLAYSTNRTARWASLGKSMMNESGEPLSRLESVRQYFIEQSANIGLHLHPDEIRICSPPTQGECVTESTGHATEEFSISATRSTRVFALEAVGQLRWRITVSARNEPF